MYDPVTAQFLQQDTYRGEPGEPLSLNLYSYCFNNPLIYVDPTGHRAQGQVLSYNPDVFDHDVKMLQWKLYKRGYLSSESDVDGFFGAKTRKAVYAYQGNEFERQRQQGIYFDVDGLVGDQTWYSLGLSDNLGMAEMAQAYAGYEHSSEIKTQGIRETEAYMNFKVGTEPPPYTDKLDKSKWNKKSTAFYEYPYFYAIKLRTWMNIYGGYVVGWDDASDNLKYFLNNTGEIRDIDIYKMFEQSKDAENLRDVVLMQAMKAGENFTVDRDVVNIVNIEENLGHNLGTGRNMADARTHLKRGGEDNWLNAIGDYYSWAEAKVIKDGERYKMDLIYHVHDSYDWHDFDKNDHDKAKRLRAGLVYDSEMRLLNEYGWAREYEIQGSQKISIYWKKGQTIKDAQVTYPSK